MLKKYQERKAEVVEELKSLMDAADAEERDLTDDEEKRYTVFDKELDDLNGKIKAEEGKEARRSKIKAEAEILERSANDPVEAPAVHTEKRGPINTDKEFSCVGEMLHAIHFNTRDKRLDSLYDTRQQSMEDGTKGGFAIPRQFMDELLSVMPDTAALRARSRVIPAGTPPDAAISIPVLDQTAGQNMYGGVQVDWLEEGGTKSETDMNLRQIELKPKEIAAFVATTDKLLRNWQAANALIGSQLMAAKTGAEEHAIYTGSGAGQPLGILNSPARINITRTTANQIAYADIVAMLARLLRRGGSPVWLCNQTVIPQLATIADTLGNNIFVMNASVGMPATLMGYPIIFNERVNSLGTAGDLCLLDMGYYLLKDGSGPFIASSEHVHFTSNRTVIKMFWNVDGQPWLNEPIRLEAGSARRNQTSSTNTVSPFIVLN